MIEQSFPPNRLNESSAPVPLLCVEVDQVKPGQKQNRSRKNLVVAVYSDERSAKAAISRLDRERFFRSAAISVAENGHRKIRAHSHILFVFASLIAAALMPALLVSDYSWAHTLLTVGAVSIAGALAGPFLGVALPRAGARQPRILSNRGRLLLRL